MEEGLRFAIREGGRTVGAGVVADHQVMHDRCTGGYATAIDGVGDLNAIEHERITSGVSGASGKRC